MALLFLNNHSSEIKKIYDNIEIKKFGADLPVLILTNRIVILLLAQFIVGKLLVHRVKPKVKVLLNISF